MRKVFYRPGASQALVDGVPRCVHKVDVWDLLRRFRRGNDELFITDLRAFIGIDKERPEYPLWEVAQVTDYREPSR